MATNNFSGSHRDLPMENTEMCSKENATKRPRTNESLGKGTPLPVILTLDANIISLRRKLETVASRKFFWKIAAGTQITKSMADCNATQHFLTVESLHYFTSHTKRDKPVKSCYQVFAWQYFYREHHCGLPGDTLRRHQCKTEDCQTFYYRRRCRRPLPPLFLINYSSKKSKSSRNFQIYIIL
jgi:hypothetical protein